MPTPQFNVRVPERYHALLRLIVERLRANPDGADALADALLAVCRQTAGSGAIGADNLQTPADRARLGSLEQPILDRLAALEAKEDSLQSLLDRLTGLVEAHTDMLRPILDRLAALEQSASDGAPSPSEGAADDLDSLCQLFEGQKAGAGGTAPAGAPLDAVEPSNAAGEPLVTGGEGTRRLTPAGIAEVERMIRAGVGDAEIAGRFGMDRGAIRQRRLKLERSSSPQSVEQSIEAIAGQQDGEGQQQLSTGEMTAIPDEHSEQAYLCQIAGMTVAEAIELKGWTWEEHELAAAVERWREKHHVQEMLLLEHHHQIATMLEAGKSGVEIKAWLAQQRAELPASHVDENPVPPSATTA
jgi:hypothetical protein